MVVEEQSRIKERWCEKESLNRVRLKGETKIMAGRAPLRHPSESDKEKKKGGGGHKRIRYDFVIECKVVLVCRHLMTENNRAAESVSMCFHSTDTNSQGMQGQCVKLGWSPEEWRSGRDSLQARNPLSGPAALQPAEGDAAALHLRMPALKVQLSCQQGARELKTLDCFELLSLHP